ncbi:hypothetical protein OGR47_08490 [Methylocystis sp. MJC1]|jgi:hypothetical protein|uniref:hypothetical protein n=1 Tax=Methylocystis sp. MJC1 TaxID=2654282 RepID=UPI0013EDEEE2|nr:hypothetical protein [Methylocystis sp. MJC1]KAF2991738.1 hypothetical protein MJC1_01303 [Methylocystis sp. MJC1]MBU6527023.1 hypothetical protein [Methylocystis sp. MJC1]UZX13461.1 hypothetical protein OGR47_08490 [Methylocystis sp. MJC1]
MKRFAKIVVVAAVCATSMNPNSTAFAHESGSCSYDESESIRCFDCSERVQSSDGSHWVNACSTRGSDGRSAER